MASIEDIIAMKLDVVARGGRKKDFWDLHELSTSHSVTEMLDLYEKRYPYNYSREDILRGFTNFDKADAEPDPMCLFHKDWDVIKRDLTETFLG